MSGKWLDRLIDWEDFEDMDLQSLKALLICIGGYIMIYIVVTITEHVMWHILGI